MRSLLNFTLLSALLGCGLLVSCDDDTTLESRPDTGPAPVDASPDRAIDQAAPIDQAAVDVPEGCGLTAPTSTTCTLAETVECSYATSTCPGGQPLTRRCTCTDGVWSCLQDLGCPTNETVGGTPEEKCGACLPPPGVSFCTYRIEKCLAAEDLWNRCTCSAGGAWSCTREYDCYPPNTCRTQSGTNCLTNGLINTGDFCPPGYTQGRCEGHPCTPGMMPWTCARDSDQHLRSAVCIYGQWACPIGYSLASPR